MTEANKNLLVRILSAALFLPVVLAALWAGTVWTGALVAVAAALLAREFYGITLPRRDGAQALGILFCAALPLIWALAPAAFAGWALGLLAGLVMATLIYYLLAGPLADAPARASLVIAGAVYCGLLLSTVAGLRQLDHGLDWLFTLLLVTFGNDTGAYAAGRLFGKHKLYPAVSPAKTWEGFAGGLIASVGGALIASATYFPALSWTTAILVGLPAGVLGPAGDLCESMLKRAYGVKDSGKLMPGHGGLLDRADALLFTSPYTYLIASLLGP